VHARKFILNSHIRAFRPAALLLYLTLLTVAGYGQIASIKGLIKSDSSHLGLSLAVVSLLTPDSILQQFTRTGADGRFQFQRTPPKGVYLILVEFPGYEAAYRSFTIDGFLSPELEISMFPLINSLQAVTVTSRSIIARQRGDTLEYSSENIRMNTNAPVEELLARLPGLQIDANGNISYNGEKIKKLMVDGEDIFGSDPGFVIHNFNADLIARIQVIDKKSDQSQFTGVDDGTRTKTLNLILKETAKKGYFGKAEAGTDTKGIYSTNGLLGSFKNKRQFTALGMSANNGILGFSGNAGGQPAELSLLSDLPDPLGGSAGKGIPKVTAGAIHFADTWKGKEHHTSDNYQYGHLFTSPSTKSTIEQILPGSIYLQNQQNNSLNTQDQHSLSGVYDLAPDSLSAYRIFINILNNKGSNKFNSTGNSKINVTPANSFVHLIQSDVSVGSFLGAFSYRTNLNNKVGRTISVNASFEKANNITSGYLYAQNRFYPSGTTSNSSDTTDQRKQIYNNSLILYGVLSYTEPLWKYTLLGFGFSISKNVSESLQNTFNRTDGKYLNVVDSLSNHVKNSILNQQISIVIMGNDPHFSYTFGGSVLLNSFHQNNLITDSIFRYQYLNFAPRALIRYSFDSYHILSFQYFAGTNLPSPTDLNPVKNNSDPLHIFLGSPNLRPSFYHRLGWYFSTVHRIVSNIGLSIGFLNNSISTKTYTDSMGRQISQTVNISGAHNAGINFSINKKLEPLGMDAGILSNLDYSRSVNYVNSQLSRNDNISTGIGLNLTKYVTDRYSLQVHTTLNYFYTSSSVNINSTTQYFTQTHFGFFSFFPTMGWEINTNGNYTWQQKSNLNSSNTSLFLWNAFVSRNLFNNRASLKLQLNNIVNQNLGINRSSTINEISDTRTNIMGRYFLLSAIYHFDHKPKTQ